MASPNLPKKPLRELLFILRMGYGLFKINPIKGKMFWMPEQRTDESFINP